MGGAGDDFLNGGAGRDRLMGGNGVDTLKGAAGQDEFVLQNFRHSADQIIDFNVNEDQLTLAQSGFDMDFPVGILPESRFTIGRAAHDRNDRIIYNDQTGALLFDADGSRSGAAIAIAFLNPNLDLSASNIRIV